jgi:hypothetical protein
MMAERKQINIDASLHGEVTALTVGPKGFGNVQDHADAACRLWVQLPPVLQGMLMASVDLATVGKVYEHLVELGHLVDAHVEDLSGKLRSPSRSAAPASPAPARPKR